MAKTANYKLTLKNSLKMVTSSNHAASTNNANKYKSNDIYLMQVCGNSKKSKSINTIDSKIACLNSEQTIGIYNEELNERTTIHDAHSEAIINEIDFFKLDHNLLLTCGDDSHVKCWDLRNPRKEVLKYDGGGESVKFLSCDIDCEDSIIAASTSNNDDNNSFIYLFDIKMNNKILEKYEGAHSNDITQVKFDCMNKNRLVSASIDGLACVFDLLNLKTKTPKKTSDDSGDEESFDEDDDLIDQVYNTSSSVQKIGFLNSNNQYLYAITFTNDLFIWDMNTQDEILKFSLFNSKNPSDYIVDCFNSTQSPNQIILCLGDRNGNIQLYNDKKDLIFNTSSIRCGDTVRNKHHSDLIRSSFWNYYQNDLFSIGEDGILNKWKLDFVIEDEASENTACSSKRSKNDDNNEDEEEEEENKQKKRKTISNNKSRNKNL